jgi:fibronectin type 3 domain-containing protein
MRSTLLICLLMVAFVAMSGAAPRAAPVAALSPGAPGGTLNQALEPSNNLDVSTATYLGGAGEDKANAVDVAPDGTLVLGGVMPGHNPGGATPVELLGGGDGVVVRFNRAGTEVLSVTRLGSSINDLEIDDSGRIVVCGDFGVVLLNSTASEALWNANPGSGKRCAVGSDGTAAVLLDDGTISVYDSNGGALGTWEVSGSAQNDIALDAASSQVFVTGYNQVSGNLQLPRLRAWNYNGELQWISYDFDSAPGLGADTRGERIAMGRDGKLYMAGSINGGTGASVFSRDPRDINESLGDRLVKTDNYNNPTNIGSVKMAWYGRFNPTSGELELAQSLLTRKEDGSGNSISIKAIAADESGRVFVAGSSSARLENRDARQVAGITVGGYEGSEPYFLAVQADFSQRIVWSPFAAPGTSAGGSPASGVGVRDGVAAVGITLNPKDSGSRGLITHNALQDTQGSLPDAYLAVWPFAAASTPTVTVDAGPDQTVFAGQTVTLQATGSENVESYSWTQTEGPDVSLETPDQAATTFTAPQESGTLVFEVTATGPEGATATDTVSISVQAVSVDAGADQQALVGNTVTLEGTGTGIESFAWEQTAGDVDVTLSTPDAASTSFTAPDITGTLTFRLTGTGAGGISATDTVNVEVLSLLAEAGTDSSAAPGATVTLSGAQSRSSQDAPITAYAWEQIGGPAVELGDTMQPTLTITIPESLDTGELVFQLTVTNTLGNSATDTVTVSVQNTRTVYLSLIIR